MFIPDRRPEHRQASQQSRRGHQTGLTLVELVISIVIISIAVSGILLVLSQTSGHSVDAQLRKQALAIAQSLLEEIELARMTYCGPADANVLTAQSAVLSATTGCVQYVENFGIGGGDVATRPYSNVDNYVTTSGTPVSYTTDAQGNSFSTAGGTYTPSVTITVDPNLGPSGSQIASTTSPVSMNVLHISVTVSYRNGANSVTLDGYRTRYAPTSPP